MKLSTRRIALTAALLAAGFASVVQAADPVPFTPTQTWMPPTISEAKRDSFDSVERARSQPITPRPLHYPNLDAPLYPAANQTTPLEMGGTVITNSYMYPHEMLYHHHYRALYPPYYYKTKWQYGVRLGTTVDSQGKSVPMFYRTKVMHKVALKGTQVDVKYDNWSLFDRFVPCN